MEEKERAYELYRKGATHQEIADEIGCATDTVKHRWVPEWKGRDAALARKVEKRVERRVDRMVEVERHQLDHLLALRELYHRLLEQVRDCEPDPEKPWKYLSLYKELRETIMASAKLEGVEPPQRIEQRTINVPGLDIAALLEDEETAELVTKLLEKHYLKSLPTAQPCKSGDGGE